MASTILIAGTTNTNTVLTTLISTGKVVSIPKEEYHRLVSLRSQSTTSSSTITHSQTHPPTVTQDP